MDKKFERFDPSQHTENLYEKYLEFTELFGYMYPALNREPPTSATTQAQKDQWVAQDKKNLFLGRCAHRNLHKIYEDIVPAEQRATITYDQMNTSMLERFRLSTNTTLSNFKFRNLSQGTNESFDAFCVRVKQEATNCAFRCESPNCNVNDTLIRDQIVVGTKDDEIRQEALKKN